MRHPRPSPGRLGSVIVVSCRVDGRCQTCGAGRCMDWSRSWRRNPPPRTRAGTVGPALIPGRGDTLVGSSPARWPPDWSLLSSLSPPGSSRPRNVPSLAPSCADSRWAGRCWRCFRSGSPISRSDGPRLRHWLWAWAACSWWGLAPRWTRCWTGCGPRPCWRWPSGCSPGSIDSCRAGADAGCCIQ
jgi:hypothetical protein